MSKDNPHISGIYTIIAALIGLFATLGAVYIGYYLDKKQQNDLSFENVKILPDTLSSENDNPKFSTIFDPNGRKYKTLVFSDLEWMIEDLNYKVDGTYCYDNDSDNCIECGLLYKYKSALSACNRLGEGWRVPSSQEWRNLIKNYGGVGGTIEDGVDGGRTAYSALINGGSSGLNFLLCGGRYSDGLFSGKGAWGSYWSSTVREKSNFVWIFHFSKGEVGMYNSEKTDAYQCRCVKLKEL